MNIKHLLFSLFIFALPRFAFTQVSFDKHVVYQADPTENMDRFVATADVDSDGFLDLVAWDDNHLYWQRNIEGTGLMGPEILIDSLNYPVSLFTKDLDGDGLLDIIVHGTGSLIAWYKKLSNQDGFAPMQYLGIADFIVPIDYDNDGDLDIVLLNRWTWSNTASVSWLEQTSNPLSFTFHDLFEINYPISFDPPDVPIAITDFNSDGLLDIVIASHLGGTSIDIYPNPMYNPIYFCNFEYVSNIKLEPMLNDDFSGFWIKSSTSIYEFYSNNSSNACPQEVLTTTGYIYDITNLKNGQCDHVFAATSHGIVGSNLTIDPLHSYTSITAADMDNDGDQDIVYVGNNISPGWYKNLSTIPCNDLFESADYTATFGLAASDIDGDGRCDILTSNASGIQWHQNTNGFGAFSVKKSISKNFKKATILTADLNNDGQEDIVGLNSSGAKWFKNNNTQFTPTNLPSTYPSNLLSSIADIDGDNDMDIIQVSSSSQHLYWLKNIDADFSSENIFFTTTNNTIKIMGLSSFDVDNDGDIDVVAQFKDHISWFENIDGLGNMGSEQLIYSNLPMTWPTKSTILHADIDNDGDQDICTIHANHLLIFKNNNLSFEQILSNNAFDYLTGVVADLDNDGDQDIIVSSSDSIFWLQNTVGLGTFNNPISISNTGASELVAKDVDQDGDMDIISATKQGQINWYENLTIPFSVHIYCPENITAILPQDSTSIFLNWNIPTAFSNCPSDSINVSQLTGSISGSAFYSGSSTVSYTATDSCNNADTCSFSITVSPTQSGEITVICPNDITVSTNTPSVNVTWDPVTASTTCTNSNQVSITQITGLPSGSEFPIGTYDIVYDLSDQCNNTQQCAFVVNVQGTGMLTINCPDDITAYTLDSSAVVSWLDPIASTTCPIGNISITQSSGLPSGSEFPIGTYNIVYDLSDQCNNTQQCAFVVNVQGTGMLTITCPDDITTYTVDSSAIVSWLDPNATTTCPLGNISITQSSGLPSGSEFPIGMHTIQYQATDDCNNTVDCSFLVNILESTSVTCNSIIGFTKLGEFNNFGYYLSENKMTWQESQILATTHNGNIASILSQDENNFLQDLLSEMVFIGLSDADSEGSPIWVDGEPLLFSNYSDCNWCGLNSDANDYAIFLPWDGKWSFNNKWVRRKFVLKKACNATNNGYLTLSCPADIMLSTTTGSATAVWNPPTTLTTCPTSTSVTITQTTGANSGTNFTLGTHTISYQATDSCGHSESCSFTITVADSSSNGNCGSIDGFTTLGEFNGHKYYLSEELLRWDLAKAEAQSKGGFLTSINTQAENDFLKAKLNNNMVFIGLNDAQDEGVLQWANGDIVTLDLSYNNSDEKDYAVMNFWAGTWEMYNYWVAKKYVMEINCTSPISHDLISNSSNIQLIDLYPNPSNQLITANLWVNTNQDIKMSIFNLQGQCQSTKSATLKTGNNHIVLNINDLENGMYFLKVTNNEMDKVIRFIKME